MAAKGRSKNIKGLTIPSTLQEDDKGSDGKLGPSSSNIEEQLKLLSMTDAQKKSMEDFYLSKKKVWGGRQIGELNSEEMERLGDLGYGNGGAVIKVRHRPSGIIMARKLIHLEVKPSIRNQIIKELKILHNCNSPYIVGFYGAFYAEGEISICMEYMDGLSLDIHLKNRGPIPEKIIGKITDAVLAGLLYLKDSLNILHRDVKPSNILVNSQGDIKICDFGVSSQLTNSTANTFVGTRSYMSPERLTGSHYTILSDVWSLGLTLVELAVGCYPVPALSPTEYAQIFKVSADSIQVSKEQLEAAEHVRARHAGANGAPDLNNRSSLSIFDLLNYIVNEPPPLLPHGPLFSEEFVDFVDKCLKKTPSERMNLRQLQEHAFVKKWSTADVDFAGWARAGEAAKAD